MEIGVPQSAHGRNQPFESGGKVASRDAPASVEGTPAGARPGGKAKRWTNSRDVVSTSPSTRVPQGAGQMAATLTSIVIEDRTARRAGRASQRA